MFKFKLSKAERVAFAEKMKEIELFCETNGIYRSQRGDSYYFNLNGKQYRVSNHTVAASNKGAFDEYGERFRPLYHPEGEKDDTVYITAGKTRIIEIYNDLKAGYELDRRGNRKKGA